MRSRTEPETTAPQTPTTRGDRVIAVVMILISVGLLTLALGFPEPGQPEDPGTTALPRLIGACLLVLSVLLLLRPESTVILPAAGARLRTVLMGAAGIVYLLLLEPVGFITSTVLFMVAGMLIMGVRSLLRLIVVPLILGFSVYYLFTAALGVYLPPGLIEGSLP